METMPAPTRSETDATADAARLARVLRALGHPARLAIVHAARRGDVSVGELADRLDLSQPVTSQHLKTLRDNDILTVRTDRNRRLYSVNPDPVRDVTAFLDSVWPAGLAALKEVAEHRAAVGPANGAGS